MLKKSEPHLSYTFPRTKKKIKNRSVLAAMTNKQSHGDGVISNQEIKWLSRRAKDGFSIITTAATHVSKYGQGWEGEFGVFENRFIDKLTLLTKNIHKYDSLILRNWRILMSSSATKTVLTLIIRYSNCRKISTLWYHSIIH